MYSDAQLNSTDVGDTRVCTKCGGTNIIIDREVGEEFFF